MMRIFFQREIVEVINTETSTTITAKSGTATAANTTSVTAAA